MAAFDSEFRSSSALAEEPVDFGAVAAKSMGAVLASRVRIADFEAEIARREQKIFQQGGLVFLTAVLAGKKPATA